MSWYAKIGSYKPLVSLGYVSLSGLFPHTNGLPVLPTLTHLAVEGFVSIKGSSHYVIDIPSNIFTHLECIEHGLIEISHFIAVSGIALASL